MLNQQQINELIAEELQHTEEKGYDGCLFNAVKKLNENGVQAEYTQCGGFDSPGYTVNCYALSYVVDGKLILESYEEIWE